MCGIVGIKSAQVPDSLAAALQALAWRGPDDRRTLQAGAWSLAVARLAITDPGSPQPIVCPETGRVVLFNGAVTSAAGERKELGGALRTGNDAELLLARLRTHGESALLRMTGPYAAVIVDPRADRLWLVRDPCGEKPLYAVTREGRVVAFASTAGSLRALGFDVALAEAEVARWFRFGFCLAPQLAAAGLELRADLRGAWVDDREGLRHLAAEPPRAPPAPLRERILHAVDRCAQAEVGVGLSLSGGVDSSCIAAALRSLKRRVPAYQFRAAGEPEGERELGKKVAQATGHYLRPVDGSPALLATLPALTRAAGLPLGDPSVLAAHAVAAAAHADGMRVLLSGEGADDLWLGYRRHRAAAMLPARGLRWLPSPKLSMRPLARLSRALASSRPYDALLEVTPPAFRRAVLVPALQRGELPEDGSRSALQRARHVDRHYYLRHDLLPKLDLATMAAGVEGRCPFLDPEVLQSDEAEAEDPRAVLGKRALKEAFRRDLPSGVLEQRKLGFGLPLDRWLREDDWLPDLLRDRRTCERGHLRAEGLARMLDLHRRGRARLGHGLFLVAAYETWLRERERG
jgi:asparagine synthase (glutamine-hydrolysing)